MIKMEISDYKYIVVGAGFFGLTLAERISNDLNQPVLIIEKRNHIGGNCHSQINAETGILYHTYGTHIFHTSNEDVWNYINKFTQFNSYYHQVLTTYNDKVYQMPINLETINSFYNLNLKPFEVADFLKNEIEKSDFQSDNLFNFESKAISQIGKPLYEAFIKGYTKKQWQIDPINLPSEIFNRLPIRYNYNESYFHDQWQGIPLNGYTPLFEKMISNPLIKLINADFFDLKILLNENAFIFYSGPIDKFFNYKYGQLSYRSLRFENEIINYKDFQGTSVMNYANEDVSFTRIHEPKHMHVERNDVYNVAKTLIIKEYPLLDKEDSPYYPINTHSNELIFNKYFEETKSLKKLIIGGRLGKYRYFDMDKTIENALDVYSKFKSTHFF